jgi:single-strand DNA-binding protein
MNRICLTGRLTDSPELRYTSSGTAVANFTLAVDRNYRKKNGEKDTDFIKIVCWQKLGEIVAENLDKGRLISVDGELHINKSKTDERTYINPEVNADNIDFLDYKDKKESVVDGFDDFDDNGFD